MDEVTGYDPRTRFRVYRVRAWGPEEIAGCETKDAIGTMLVQLHEDGEFGDDAVGVMDTGPREHGGTGVWIVNPFSGR